MMNSKRIIGAIATTALSSAIVLSSVSADEGRSEMGQEAKNMRQEMKQDMVQMRNDFKQERKEDKNQMKHEIKENRAEMKDNRQEFRAEYGPFTAFVKPNLTEEEKVAIKSILDAHKATMDELLKAQREMMSGATMPTEQQKVEWMTKMKAAQEKLVAALTPYVDVAKLEEFKKTLGVRQEVYKENQTLRNENKEIRKEFNGEMKEKREEFRGEMKDKKEEVKQGVKTLKSALSEKARATLVKKLDSIPAEKKEAFYTSLLAKIDAVLAKVQNSKTKAQLTEMRAIVQDKLDALTASDDESLVNEILSDTPAQ